MKVCSLEGEPYCRSEIKEVKDLGAAGVQEDNRAKLKEQESGKSWKMRITMKR